jgi:hypothetical protein
VAGGADLCPGAVAAVLLLGDEMVGREALDLAFAELALHAWEITSGRAKVFPTATPAGVVDPWRRWRPEL